MFLELTYKRRTITVEEHDTPSTAYDALVNVWVPALRAQGFSDSEIASACQTYADDNLPPLSQSELDFFATDEFDDETMTISITNEHGEPWREDDGTPVEITLPMRDYMTLMDAAQEAGQTMDEFITNGITEQISNMLNKESPCECKDKAGCCDPSGC